MAFRASNKATLIARRRAAESGINVYGSSIYSVDNFYHIHRILSAGNERGSNQKESAGRKSFSTLL